VGRISELEHEVADQREALRTLHEQLAAAQQDSDSLRGDLVAAEHQIRSADVERHARDARLVRLEAGELVLRTRLEALERELDERNEQLRRLQSASIATTAFGATATGVGRAAGDAPTFLLVRTEGDTGIVHVLRRRTTIGRTPDNDVQVDAEFISRHHAVVLVSATGTFIEDLNSTNGVYVNSVRIARRELLEGDLVTIGKTGFRFVRKPPAELAARS
jgi:pSer/pThr/pTyr-binding forkhead associated (FHA) protein